MNAEQAAPNTGLVLEGGGMRATYTGGVVDAFMDHGLDFRYVIGVSAGANAGADYVAGQRERNRRVFVELATDKRFAGPGNLLRERSWFGMRFLFETLPDELAPFNYAAFHASPRLFVVGVTDCLTGLPTYFRQRDYDPRWFTRTVERASSSLPVLSPPVMIMGRPCLDGGISDSIPIGRCLADGNRRAVVVLTRNAGFRKPPERLGRGPRLLLRRYPAIIDALQTRHERYNACLQRLEELERAGTAFVIRPIRPLVVDRLERNQRHLEELYRQGYDETVARLPQLRRWLARDLNPEAEEEQCTTTPITG